jgi:hypothetical protein
MFSTRTAPPRTHLFPSMIWHVISTANFSHITVNNGAEPKCAVKGLWRDRYSARHHLMNTIPVLR